MARFEMDGIDQLLRDVWEAGEGAGELADEMLMAAAEEVKQCWKDAIRKHNLIDTSSMLDKTGYARKPKNVNGIKEIDIYPQGKDAKGTRNAEKAFVLHYGTRTRKATRFVDDADKASGPRSLAVMEKIWDKYLERKGL